MKMNHRVVDAGFRVLNLVHRSILRSTGSRLGASAFGLRFVELHTVGRRTGRERTVVLASPVVEGDSYVLVASKGGDARDPDWFKNLLVQPEVVLKVGVRSVPARARVASEDEAAQLWPRIIAAYRPYASYRRRTTRTIPLVICEPRHEAADGVVASSP